MMNAPGQTTRVWDLPVRVFHWALVASFAGAYALGDTERWRNVHVALGYTVLGLIAFRVLWGFIGTRYARFRAFAYCPRSAARHLRDEVAGRARRYLGHNPAGSWVIYALVLLGLVTGIAGYALNADMGGHWLEEFHEAAANAMLALVVVHIAGVVVSSLLHRENLALAMLNGYKRGEPGEGIRRTRWATAIVLVVGAGLVAGTVLQSPPAGSTQDAAAERHERRNDHREHREHRGREG